MEEHGWPFVECPWASMTMDEHLASGMFYKKWGWHFLGCFLNARCDPMPTTSNCQRKLGRSLPSYGWSAMQYQYVTIHQTTVHHETPHHTDTLYHNISHHNTLHNNVPHNNTKPVPGHLGISWVFGAFIWDVLAYPRTMLQCMVSLRLWARTLYKISTMLAFDFSRLSAVMMILFGSRLFKVVSHCGSCVSSMQGPCHNGW